MKISVVIPVYNAAAYLEGTLRSVVAAAARTDAAVEIVCVDDGSTDASGAILDAFAAQNESGALAVRVIHQPNGGVSSARNCGMDESTGDLIAFLDADDTFHPQALDVFAKTFEKTQADLIRYDVKVVSSHGEDETSELPSGWKAVPLELGASGESPIRKAALGWASAVSRSLASSVRWPSLTHCEDPLFVLRCFRLARSSVRVNASLANYLVRPDSASREVSLPIVRATCLYLPMAYDACEQLPCREATRVDTCAFIAGFLDGPLKGCWKKLPRADRDEAKRSVLCARRAMVLRNPSFFPEPKERLEFERGFVLKKRFDLVFSLGSACSSTQTLRAAGLQLASFPLDWVSGGDIKSRARLLLGGFKDWMPKEEEGWERKENPKACLHDTYRNRVTGLVHPHDFDQGRPFCETYPSVKAKYDRRVARLLGLLAKARRVLVVWVGDPRDEKAVTAVDVRDCLTSFRERYPGAEFRMLALDCRPGIPPSSPKTEEGDDFRIVAFDYQLHSADAPVWAVDSDLLAPWFAGLAVRDYRTVAERRAFAAAERRRELARFGAKNAFELFVTKLQYRLWRHLGRKLEKKGVRID